MADDAIASLRGNVSVDLSELRDELAKIPALMAQAAAGFADSGDLFSKTVDNISQQFKGLQDELDATKPKTDSVGESVQHAGGAASGAAPHFHELKESVSESASGFVELAEKIGIAIGIFEIVKESLKAFSEIQNVTTSFGLLAGSVETAASAVEDLKGMADKLAISEETLLSTAQRLAPQFGVGTDAMKNALQAAADAAAATGRNFETVASSIERVALTGQVGARQLVQLGVSMGDIATTMGTTVAQAEALMKKGGLDATEQVQVLIDTIERRFPGAAEAIAGNLSGQFQQLKNEFHNLAEEMGKALAPVATDIIGDLRDKIVPAIRELLELFGRLPEPVQKAVIEITALGVALRFTGAISALGALAEAIGAVGGASAVAAGSVTALGTALNVIPFVAIATAAGLAGVAIAKLAEGANADSIERSSAAVKNLGDSASLASHATNEAADHASAYNTVLAALRDTSTATVSAEASVEQSARSHAVAIGLLKVQLEETRKSITELNAQEQSGFDVQDKLTAAHQRETEILRQLNPGLRSVFETTKDSIDVSEQAQMAALAEAQARQDSLVPAKELEEVTRSLQQAEDALANASRATYVPALIDHATAIAHLERAEASLAASKQAVIDAEKRLQSARDAEMSGAAAPGAIASATKELEKAERNLKDSVTALHQAEKDQGESRKFLLQIDRELLADELAILESRKKLYPATNDISKATGEFSKALTAARDADRDLKQAQADLSAELITGSGNVQRLTELEDAARTARERQKIAVKALDDATASLTERYRINRETLILLKQHNDEWSQSMKEAQAAMSDLGLASGAVLDEIARKSKEDYDVIAASNLSAMEKARALEQTLRDQIAAMEAVGQNSDGLKLKLSHLEEQIRLTKEGWAGTILEMRRAVETGLTKALDDAIFKAGDVGKAFKAMGEQIVDIFLNHILEKALKPLLDEMDKLILKAVTFLEKVFGVSTGGTSSTTPPIAGGTIPGLGGSTGSSGGGGGGLGGSGGTGGSAATLGAGTGTLIAPGIGTVIGAAVGALVDLGTKIFSMTQEARQEGTLNAIEQHTKVMAIGLMGIAAPWETVKAGQNTLFFKVGDIKNLLQDIREFNWNVLHSELVKIIEAVNWPAYATTWQLPFLDSINKAVNGKPVLPHDAPTQESTQAQTSQVTAAITEASTAATTASVGAKSTLDQINTAASGIASELSNLPTVLSDIGDAISQLSDNIGTAPTLPPETSPPDIGGPPSIDDFGNLMIPLLYAWRLDISDFAASIAAALPPALGAAPTLGSDIGTPPMTGNVYLDGQELWSSFVRFLEQSGTPAPSY